MSSTISKYLAGSTAGFLQKGVSILSGFGSLWLLNKILTKQGFGEYTVAFTILGLAGLAAQAGFRDSVVQRIAEYRSTKERSHRRFSGAALSWTAIFGISLGILLYTVSLVITSILNQPRITPWLQVFSILVPGSALVTVARSIEQGRENYVYSITLLQIAPRLLRLSGFGLAYWYLPGLEGIATALLISYYLPVTIFGVQRQEWRWMNISEIKYSDWRFSGELFLNSMASQLFQNLDVLLITALASSIATSNYQVAWKIALVIGYTNQILSTVLKPRLSSYLANNNPAELRQEFTIVRDTTIIFASFTLLVAVVAGETLLSLFGEYSDSYPLLVVLATGQFVNTSFGNVHNVLMMGKEGRLILLNSILGIGINFLGNLLLIPLYHELGAAISTVLTVFIFSNIVAVWLIQHSLDVKLFDLYATGGAFACGSLIITFVFLRLPAHRTISGVALIVFCIALVHHNRAEIVSQYQDLQS